MWADGRTGTTQLVDASPLYANAPQTDATREAAKDDAIDLEDVSLTPGGQNIN
jgi:hypothetical protein